MGGSNRLDRECEARAWEARAWEARADFLPSNSFEQIGKFKVGTIVTKNGTNLSFVTYGQLVDRAICFVSFINPVAIAVRTSVLIINLFSQYINYAGELIKVSQKDNFQIDNWIQLTVGAIKSIAITIICAKIMNIVLLFGVVAPNNAVHTYARLEQLAYGDFYCSKVFMPKEGIQ